MELYTFGIFAFIYGLYILIIVIKIISSIIGELWLREWKVVQRKFIGASVIHTLVGPVIGFLRFDDYGSDMPFSKKHVLTIFTFYLVATCSYWYSIYYRSKMSYYGKIITTFGIVQGILLCLIISIHFANYYHLGLLFPFCGFELLCPIVAFFLLLKELIKIQKHFFRNTFPSFHSKDIEVYSLIHKLEELFLFVPFLLLFIFIQIIVLQFFGQDIDSVFKVFSESSGFVFSN
ncbi:MAG: hypothetical protein HYR91_09465 [Flavobacteriia bacterium]|nr:hypothetical protein [Flavobacteriia bacterium]